MSYVGEKPRVCKAVTGLHDSEILRLYPISEEKVGRVRIALFGGPQQTFYVTELLVDGLCPTCCLLMELRWRRDQGVAAYPPAAQVGGAQGNQPQLPQDLQTPMGPGLHEGSGNGFVSGCDQNVVEFRLEYGRFQ